MDTEFMTRLELQRAYSLELALKFIDDTNKSLSSPWIPNADSLHEWADTMGDYVFGEKKNA